MDTGYSNADRQERAVTPIDQAPEIEKRSPRHVACIIQARRNSRRLPDKVMRDLCGKMVIEHVIDRAKKIPGVDSVIVATVDDAHHDALADIAQSAGALVCRGSTEDVLSRYHKAAQMVGATHVIRITSDCPLFDPRICGDLLSYVIAQGGDYGAAAGFPHGMDCEAFTADALDQAHHAATIKEDREHVTLWMKNNSALKVTHYINPDPATRSLSRYRLVIDYPEDFAMVEALINKASPDRLQSLDACIKVLIAFPELCDINAAVIGHWAKNNREIMEKRAEHLAQEARHEAGADPVSVVSSKASASAAS